MSITARNSAESALKNLQITSTDGKHSIDLVTSVTELCYYESLMLDSICVRLKFADTGSTEGLDGKTLKEVFPLTTTERVDIKLSQEVNGEEIVLGGKNKLTLYVNDYTTLYEDSRKNLIDLEIILILLTQKNKQNERKNIYSRNLYVKTQLETYSIDLG